MGIVWNLRFQEFYFDMAKLRQVGSEEDFLKTMAGDRVKVRYTTSQDPQWMVYMGHQGAEMNNINCHFAQIPSPEADLITIWQCYLRYLQFPGDYVHFNPISVTPKTVKRGSPRYEEAKKLIDMPLE
jgi:hypothetical protein